MKIGEPHIVPLARQALAILGELQPFARGGRYLFPSLPTRDRPMSNNTINAALRCLGYSSEEDGTRISEAWRAHCSMSRGFPRM
jgi:integrase